LKPSMRIDEIERNTYKNSRSNIFSFKRYKLTNQVQKDKNTTLYDILSFSFFA
jgi:hypothetical protein